MSKLSALRQFSHFNKIVAVCAAVVVIGVGYILINTRAASFFASVEPELATLSGNAATLDDPTASAGKALQFNAPAPPPPPPPPPPPTGTRTCPPFPAFPDAKCTGVPAGTNLTTVNGDAFITQAGTVYTDKDVTGTIYVRADKVTIKRVKARGGIQMIDNTGLVIEDTEVGPSTGTGGDDGIAFDNYTCLRCNIHNFSDAAKINGTVTMIDSYIHDLWFKTGDHNDGLQAYGGSGNITLRHNYISSAANSQGGQNAAILIADGYNGTVTLEQNLFDSYGVYAVRLHENGKYYVRNNRWTRNADNTHTLNFAQILEWTGNAYQDNGQAISQ
ncbi:MAG: right-handed parallel beta-helix repeat-containing protein [Patescibacteria group bacterium]